MGKGAVHARDQKSKCVPSYCGLLHSFDFLGVISGLPLGSLPCIVCCMLCFVCAYGVPGCVFVMTAPRYLHLSIRFYFFQPCLPPRLHPSRRPHGHQRLWRGCKCGNRRGHYMQFWRTYCGLRFHPRPLLWFQACKCCMYVRSKAQLSNPMCTNASWGWPQSCFATAPRNIPSSVGYGWQCFPRDKFWVRVWGRTTRQPVTQHNNFLWLSCSSSFSSELHSSNPRWGKEKIDNRGRPGLLMSVELRCPTPCKAV